MTENHEYRQKRRSKSGENPFIDYEAKVSKNDQDMDSGIKRKGSKSLESGNRKSRRKMDRRSKSSGDNEVEANDLALNKAEAEARTEALISLCKSKIGEVKIEGRGQEINTPPIIDDDEPQSIDLTNMETQVLSI